MIIKDKLHSAVTILWVKLFKRRLPFAVRLQLTNRCTLQCKYCTLWNSKVDELSTTQIRGIISQLALLRTKRISLSGGEPLLREDIAEIISFCREKGIYPEMNSNGTLVPQKIEKIRDLDFLKLSLDGPEEVHDFLRGEGSYRRVISAADSALKNKVNFGFSTTMTKHNINHLGYILDLAKKYDTIVAFQPLKNIYRGVKNVNDFSPGKDDFRKAVQTLINEKRGGNKCIRNTLSGLWHIYDWPIYSKLKCWAGYIFCIINANGDICPCDRINYELRLPNCLEVGVRNALEALPEHYCNGCGFCGALELNYIMELRINTLGSIKKIIDTH